MWGLCKGAVNRSWTWATGRSVAIYVFIFVISSAAVVAISLPDYGPDFWSNVKVEAHGMLFDILVLGILFSWLQSRGENRRLIQRYLDEIDDFRGWKSEEAMRRIRGNILRLNKEGVHKIPLHRCFLKGIDLEGVDLKETNLRQADLRGANLQNADLRGANLQKCRLMKAYFRGAILHRADLRHVDLLSTDLRETDLQKADLRGAALHNVDLRRANLRDANVDAKQLCEARSLFMSKLTPDLKSQVRKLCSRLLEAPSVEE